MLKSGDWIKPTFNAELRDHKPALLYWLQALSYLAFGINEFAARFPSAVAALITVLLSYELARSMFARPPRGLLAGIVVATTPMMCGAGRFANPDALLNCFTVLTLAVFWFGVAERRWWWFVGTRRRLGFGDAGEGAGRLRAARRRLHALHPLGAAMAHGLGCPLDADRPQLRRDRRALVHPGRHGNARRISEGVFS